MACGAEADAKMGAGMRSGSGSRLSARWGAAHNGLSEWFWQRLTAALLLLLLPTAFWLLWAVAAGSLDAAGLARLASSLPVRVLHTLLAAAALAHGWLGARVIIEDYLHCPWARVPVVGALGVAAAGLGVAWLALVWGLAGGA